MKEKIEKKPIDKYLTIQSVAETLSCSDRYIYELIQMGALTAVKIGPRALRVSEMELQTFIAARIVNPEDYFAPEEPAAPEPRTTKVARSVWMEKK